MTVNTSWEKRGYCARFTAKSEYNNKQTKNVSFISKWKHLLLLSLITEKMVETKVRLVLFFFCFAWYHDWIWKGASSRDQARFNTTCAREHCVKLLSVNIVWLQMTRFFQTFWGEMKSYVTRPPIFTRLVRTLVSICDDKNANKCTWWPNDKFLPQMCKCLNKKSQPWHAIRENNN